LKNTLPSVSGDAKENVLVESRKMRQRSRKEQRNIHVGVTQEMKHCRDQKLCIDAQSRIVNRCPIKNCEFKKK
jgi:hypothetical protein